MPESKRPKAWFVHFGCRLNQYESDALKTDFASHGYDLAESVEEADLLVLNTCSVTGRADIKNRAAIRRLNRQNPQARIVLTGCYASIRPEELSSLPGVFSVVKNENKAWLRQIVENGRLPDNPADGRFAFAYRNKSGNARAYLKVQDGCDKTCSYCQVPFSRGRAVSRPFADALAEARHLVSLGFHEIILTGVNIGAYRDGAYGLADLIDALSALDGDYYLRLSSIEPPDISPALLRLFTQGKLAAFLHAPLQSGSNRILSLMQRGYSRELFADKIAEARAILPHIHIGTDVIAGFPGETGEDFQETLDLLQQTRPANLHAFSYSARPGTEVVRLLSDKALFAVSPEETNQRMQKLILLQETLEKEYRQQTAGSTVRAIVENRPGRAIRLVSENYLRLSLPGELRPDHGSCLRVTYNQQGEASLA